MPAAAKLDVQVAELAKNLDSARALLDSTARLSLQTAHRVNADSTRRSVVGFRRGEFRAKVQSLWTEWQRTSKLPWEERPKEKPAPLKAQVGMAILEYLRDHCAMVEDAERRLQTLSLLPSALESVQILSAKEDAEALPIICCFRNSESAQLIRDGLLQDDWKTCLGKSYDLGFRPCRPHVIGGPRACSI